MLYFKLISLVKENKQRELRKISVCMRDIK
jgi:hypothetical protein